MRASSLSFISSSFLAFSAVACGGGIADESSATKSDASAAAPTQSSPKSDAGSRVTSPSPTGPIGTSDASAPLAIDAGAPSRCPNGQPSPGETCTNLGPLCHYQDVDCACQVVPGGGSHWACGPTLPDGGAGCGPSTSGSCQGYEGARCDLGFSVCVCQEGGGPWSCSDG